MTLKEPDKEPDKEPVDNSIDEPTIAKPVLDIANVALRQPGSKVGRLRRFSMSLQPGAVAMIHRPSREIKTLLADAVLGTIKPRHGAVKFMDNDWCCVSYQKQLAMRSQIGRVFCSGGWISNLSLADNVKLLLRHHTVDSERSIEQKLSQWTKRFGIKIPSARPAFVQPDVLRVCQWIRAFLSQPKLLMLECPFKDVSLGFQAAFIEAEHQHRLDGGATVWVTDNPFVWQRDLKGDATRYKIEGDRIKKAAA